jgi:hypothetical protein
MERIQTRLLAEMNAMREKMYSDKKKMKEEMKTHQTKMDAWLEEMKAWRKIRWPAKERRRPV